jgi:hypothetical protein
MLLHSLTCGALVPFLQEWTTLHQQESRWKLAPGSLTSGGDHLYINGSPAATTTSAPAATTTSAPSGLPAVATTPGCAPLQGGPRPCPPMGGDNEAIKAKESGTRRQVALMVSPAEATTSATGSLTSGDDHLSTDDSDPLWTSQRRLPQHARRGPHSRPLMGVRTRPSKNAAATPAAYGVL